MVVRTRSEKLEKHRKTILEMVVSENGQHHWPVPEPGHPGTPRLHEEEFLNGKGQLSVVYYREPAESVSDEFPTWLTTGRRLESSHTRTQTGRSAGIN